MEAVREVPRGGAWHARMAQLPEKGLSWKSALVGSVVGTLLCFTNMFFGLQTGWITLASVQTAVLGYGLCAVWQRVLQHWQGSTPVSSAAASATTHDAPAAPPLSVFENVCIQTIAVAINSMPLAAGFVGVLPALSMLPAGGIRLDVSAQLAWAVSMAFFGVFTAAPLRQRAIVKDRLPFPSGTASGYIIAALHGTRVRDDADARQVDRSAPEGSESEEVPLFTHTHTHTHTDAEAQPAGSVEQPARDAEVTTDDSPLSMAVKDPPGSTNEDADEEMEFARALAHTHTHTNTHGAAGEAGKPLDTSRMWQTLSVSLLGSGAFALMAYFLPVLGALPVFSLTQETAAATRWGWTLSLSPSGIGQGMIMGWRSCSSMLLGAVAGWGIIAPASTSAGWSPGSPMDWRTGGRAFILWIALSILLADSLLSLFDLLVGWAVDVWRQRRHAGAAPAAQADSCTDFPADELITSREWVTGLLLSTVLAVVLLSVTVRTVWYEPFIAVLLSLPVSAIAVRAMGETDMNPASGISKLSQAVFGAVAPGNVLSNLVAGAVAEAGAMQSGDLMHDYRVGWLLGVSPRVQFLAQLFGAALGAVVCVGAYNLYASAFDIPSTTLPAPTAAVWIAMAQLVNGGSLPPNCMPFCVVFALLVVLRHAILVWLPRCCGTPRMPWRVLTQGLASVSPVAFGIGMYVAPSWGTPRLLGALICVVWARYAPASYASYHTMLATGLLLGEGLVSIVTAVLASAGVRPATCAGCAVGQCGSFCP